MGFPEGLRAGVLRPDADAIDLIARFNGLEVKVVHGTNADIFKAR